MRPVTPAEFAALISPLGPWPAQRRVGVAVSGGADSLALALLVAQWGRPFALIVDHGLRPSSDCEAALTASRLAAADVPSRMLLLRDLRPGPGLAARARDARYAALIQAAREHGLTDLLLAHHLRDQAETVLMRRRAHSGGAGLAAMAAVSETPFVRLVRPLLSVPPGRLRATLQAAGVNWVEDPTNHDPAALRARLRMELNDPDGDGPETAALAAAATDRGAERAAMDSALAAVLAQRATIRPEGFALITPGPLPAPALSALIRTIGGGAYPASAAAIGRLAAAPAPAVIGGVRLLAAGRLGPGILLVREAAQMAPPIAARAGAVWDRRFRLLDDPTPINEHGATMGALGADAAALRAHSDLPAAILLTLPALRIDGSLAAVPHIGYFEGKCRARMVFSPTSNAAGAPFVPVRGVPTAAANPMLDGAALMAAKDERE